VVAFLNRTQRLQYPRANNPMVGNAPGQDLANERRIAAVILRLNDMTSSIWPSVIDLDGAGVRGVVIGHKIYSGVGGQNGFLLRGARLARCGNRIIAGSSTAKSETRSPPVLS